MKYLILTQNSTSYAQSISEQFWKIRKPASNNNDVSKYYCGHIVHSDGRVALQFPDELLKIHTSANLQPLIDLVTENLTEQQSSDVADHINGLIADDYELPHTIENVLPSLFQGNLKTRAQMDSDGWFAGGDI